MLPDEILKSDFSLKKLFSPLTTGKAITIIAILGFAIYTRMLLNGFAWDDLPQYIDKPITHSLLNIPQILADKDTFYYRPFAAIVFASIYSVFGANAFWFHLLQLLLHTSNTILLFLLLKKFVSKPISLLLSLIFLIHPMNVETVAYISALQTVLSLFFGLLAFFLIGYKKLALYYTYGIIFISLLFSVLSKETGWLFFALIPLFMIMNKLSHFTRKDYFLFALSCLLTISVYISLAASYLIAITAPGALVVPIPMLHATLSERLITLPKVIFYYIYTFVFPKDLAVSQHWMVKSVDFSNFTFPLIIDIICFSSIIIAGLFLARKKHNRLAIFIFFAIWFLLSFMISWQLIPLDMTVADRWFYFPMIGLLGMSAIYLESLGTKQSIRYYIYSIFIILIIGYSVRTSLRIADWRDSLTLFRHDVLVTPHQSYDLYKQLGYNLLLQEQYNEAKPYLEEAVRLAPDDWGTWNNLGTYYTNTGQVDKGVNAFSTAIEINPKYYPAYLNIVRAYYLTDRLQEARAFIDSNALVKFPQVPYFWSVKGAAEYRLGNKQEGIDALQKAYSLSNDPFYYNMLLLMQKDQDISKLQ